MFIGTRSKHFIAYTSFVVKEEIFGADKILGCWYLLLSHILNRESPKVSVEGSTVVVVSVCPYHHSTHVEKELQIVQIHKHILFRQVSLTLAITV